MKLSVLKEFVILAEELNFTKAANQLFISQPALSKHVSDLEQSLGAILLIRNRHAVSLTDAGKVAYEHFKTILDEYSSLETDIKALHADTTSQFRFGALYYGAELIHPVLTALGETYPNYQPSLFYFQPVPLINALEAGEIDVAITYHYQYENDARFTFHDFAVDAAVLVVNDKHRLAGLDCVSLNELQDETFVALKSRPYLTHVRRALSAAGIVNPQFEYCDQIDALDLALQKSGGISVMPASIRNMARPSIRLVPIEGTTAQFIWSVVCKKESDSPAVQPILEIVDKLFAKNAR